MTRLTVGVNERRWVRRALVAGVRYNFRHSMKHLVAALTGLLILAGCGSAPPPVVDTRVKDLEAIRAAEVQGSADWASRDVDRIARFWADDAALLMPGQPAVKGNAAIKAAVKQILADKNFAITFSPTTVEVAKSGEIGYTEGAATLTMTDPKTKKVVTETDKYVTIYRKQADGGWRAVADINNADGPAVGVKAVKTAPAKGKPSAKRAVKAKAAAKKRKL